MPTLAYDIDSTHYAGPLTGRVLIGRRLSHGVVLADPGVSRLHAWVDPKPDGTWAVTDAGSKTGTFVNDQQVARLDLRDGDVIRVGSTRITFRAGGDLPPAAEPVVLTPPPGDRVRTSGVLFDCDACGSPIWVGNDLIGKRGRCRHCQRQIVVPTPAAVTAPPPPQPTPSTDPTTAAGRRPQCGVCHAAIGAGEELTVCPECDITYHTECWAENYGCSTYGCGHVDALNPAAPPKPAPAAAEESLAEPVAEPTADDQAPADAPYADEDDEVGPPRMQWEWVTVLAVLLASAVGAVLYGLPALAVGIIPTVMLLRRGPQTRVGLLVVAIVLALIGLVAGLAVSDFMWHGGAHLPGHVR